MSTSFQSAMTTGGFANLNATASAIMISEFGIPISNVTYTGNGGAAFQIDNFNLGTAGSYSGGILLSSGGLPGSVNTVSSFSVNHNAAGDAGLTSTVQAAFSGAGSTFDASIIQFNVNISDPTIDGIRFDLIFGSDEFPEYSNSQYVDVAAIYVNGTNYALFDGNPLRPLSVLNSNLQYFTNNNIFPNSPFPIEWDGFSSKLTIIAPVQQGANTIKIAIADTGDRIYDSGIYINNIALTSGGGTVGGPLQSVPLPSSDDPFQASPLSQFFDLLGLGPHIVTGTPEQFNNDLFGGFSPSTLLNISIPTSFSFPKIPSLTDLLGPAGLEALNGLLNIFPGSAVIQIDTDLDGNPDSTFTLQGDFIGKSFILTPTDDGFSFSVVGDMSALVQNAHLGVLRSALDALSLADAVADIAGGLTFSQYVSGLLDLAQTSTLPSVILPAFVEGVTPDTARLDILAPFAQLQYNYYASIGVLDPSLGPYEALGMGLSETTAFIQQFGSLTDNEFITSSYLKAFDRGATNAQIVHFQGQIDYFEALYTGAGIAPDAAAIRARGAVVGQMLGYAVKEAGNDYHDAAQLFLVDATDGHAKYGSSLMDWVV